MPNKLNRILVIDDNDIDLKINHKVITLAGLFNDVILCKSGEEGLSYINRYINSPNKYPDFILLDIQMPDMDGFDFLEYYKDLPIEFLNHCKLAILSSTLDFGDIKKAEANPYVVKLIKKPLYAHELKDILVNHYSTSVI